MLDTHKQRKVGRRKDIPKSVRMPKETQEALAVLSKLEKKSIGELLTEMSKDLMRRKYPELKQMMLREEEGMTF